MSMTIDQAITRAFLHAQRKATAPASGTPKYNALLGIADSMTKLWEAEPNMNWNSLYQLVTLTPVVSATDTYAMPTTINYVSKRESDKIRITNGTSTTNVGLVNANQLYRDKDKLVAADIGTNLVFSKAFDATSSLIGYNIQVPSYVYVTDITSGSQTVQVDRPMWLVYMMAAEFIRNDVVRSGQYDHLLALADIEMQKMKQANRGSYETVDLTWQPAGESWI